MVLEMNEQQQRSVYYGGDKSFLMLRYAGRKAAKRFLCKLIWWPYGVPTMVTRVKAESTQSWDF